MSKKQTKTAKKKSWMRAFQYWVIDTSAQGESRKDCTATGPFKTQRAAEKHIMDDHKALWESSCACLQSATNTPWSGPLHIVKHVRTVLPEITAKVKLVDGSEVLEVKRS